MRPAFLPFFLLLGLTGLGTARAQTDGAKRWEFSTLSTSAAGTILSSPAVGPDGTVYVGVEVGTSGSATPGGRVFALNPNGTQKWVFTSPDWVEATPAGGADGTRKVAERSRQGRYQKFSLVRGSRAQVGTVFATRNVHGWAKMLPQPLCLLVATDCAA
jgi:outer membrane protein assembly factor BamB